MSVRFASDVKISEPSTPPINVIPDLSAIYSLDQDEDSLYTNQILDIIFESNPNEKLGFGVRIDTEKQMLQINSISDKGEAQRVGLKQADIILAVNDENIGQNPQIGIDELKKAKSSTETISIHVTVCRRIFDHILVKVQRSGIDKCNGEYVFSHLDDDFDSPIFINEENNILLLKSNYDSETGESLWALCDEQHMYYIGSSMALMPPNNSWTPIEKIGKYPSPGLVFYNKQQRLIEVEDDNEEETVVDNDEQMSPMKQEAMNNYNPSSFRSKHSRVFQTFYSLSSGNLLLGVDIYDDDEDDDEKGNEWKGKYNELMKKYLEAHDEIEVLRGNIEELNASFYQLWLKNKIQQEIKDIKDVSDKDNEIKELNDKLDKMEQEKNAKISELQKKIEMLKQTV